ncbi:MAG: GntR family transcriptional regulator [Candidatus Dormibacteria bacterium]
MTDHHPGGWASAPLVRRESAAQVVYKLLREAVVNHDLAPSARLLEPELALHLSVSRTPVREALRALEADGFVKRLPNGGLVVAGVDARDVRELYAVRMALESLAAREAACRATMHNARELVSILDEADRLAADSSAVVRLGGKFHQRITEVADNRRAADLLEKLHDHIVRYRLATAVQSREHHDSARQEHRRIADAILEGKPVAAERAMRSHVQREGAFLLKALTDNAGAQLAGGPARVSPARLRPALGEL